MRKQLFNPFIHIAGSKALLLGFAAMLLTGIAARYSLTHFDGVLDTHIGADTHIVYYALEPLVDWLSISSVLYLGSIIFSTSRTRWIDIGGTTAFSRTPMLIAALAAFAQPANVSISNIPLAAIVVAIVLLLCTIWMVALMYNALSVSANLKAPRLIPVFIGELLLAEIVSKLILHFIYKTF
jgi:hypothetical protein